MRSIIYHNDNYKKIYPKMHLGLRRRNGYPYRDVVRALLDINESHEGLRIVDNKEKK